MMEEILKLYQKEVLEGNLDEVYFWKNNGFLDAIEDWETVELLAGVYSKIMEFFLFSEEKYKKKYLNIIIPIVYTAYNRAEFKSISLEPIQIFEILEKAPSMEGVDVEFFSNRQIDIVCNWSSMVSWVLNEYIRNKNENRE